MDAFATKVAEIDARAAHDLARRRLWLSHHWPEHWERCVAIRGRHVCRRCLVLYPLTFVIAIAALADVLLWPRRFDPLLIWLCSVPGTIEYGAEQLGFIRYGARRQALATALVAVALGRGLSYELDQRWSWYFWGPLIAFGTVWFSSTVLGRHRASL